MRAIALVVIAGCGRVGFAPTSDAADDGYVPPDIVVQPGCSATSVGVGELHTCVLVENGTTYCTGENAFAQLGVGSVTANVETPVVATRITGASTLHAGRGFTCSVDPAGVVSCLGINSNRQCGAQVPGPVLDGINPTGLPPIGQLATGYSSACATTTAGDVYCWGDGDEGQGGNGTDPGTHSPEVVPALAGMSPTTALGTSHVCATVPSGVVSCWGDATDLRIGGVGPDTCANASAGSIECALQPTSVVVPAMKSVATGDEHSCVLTQASGEVWCWGANDQGQVGVARSPSEMPQRIGTLTGITQLALGKDHTCVVDAAGAV